MRFEPKNFKPMRFDPDHMTNGMKKAQKKRFVEFDRQLKFNKLRMWRWKILDAVFIAGVIAAFAWFVLSVVTLWSIGHPG
jgi:hypothetical protein